MATYEIFTEWRRGRVTVREATGAREEASSAAEAMEKAHVRGLGWGLGAHRNYVGLVAIKASRKPARAQAFDRWMRDELSRRNRGRRGRR